MQSKRSVIVGSSKFPVGEDKEQVIKKINPHPMCPKCKDRKVGKIGNNAFFCRECCIEFRKDGSRILPPVSRRKVI